jgi:hypothetical protein
MNMTLNTYEAVYRDSNGNELYTKFWLAPTWHIAYDYAFQYLSYVSDKSFDFVLTAK